eukprot:gene6377-biopygen10088
MWAERLVWNDEVGVLHRVETCIVWDRRQVRRGLLLGPLPLIPLLGQPLEGVQQVQPRPRHPCWRRLAGGGGGGAVLPPAPNSALIVLLAAARLPLPRRGAARRCCDRRRRWQRGCACGLWGAARPLPPRRLDAAQDALLRRASPGRATPGYGSQRLPRLLNAGSNVQGGTYDSS